MNPTFDHHSASDKGRPCDAKPASAPLPDTLTPDQRIDLEAPGMRVYYLAMTHFLSSLTREKDENTADQP